MSFDDIAEVGSAILKQGVKNIKSVGFKGGGEYLESAITGAAIGAAARGTTEWAQGGSFTSGAVNGAVGGAVMGMGYRGAKIGATGHDWKNSGIGDVVNKGYQGISKQVTSINKNRQNAGIVKTVMEKGKTSVPPTVPNPTIKESFSGLFDTTETYNRLAKNLPKNTSYGPPISKATRVIPKGSRPSPFNITANAVNLNKS